MRRFLTAALISVVAAANASADSRQPAGNVAATDVWARATPGAARAGAAFLTLSNRGTTARRLVAIETDVARRAELHSHLMDGTIMRMRRIDGIDLPPGESVTLKPGGHHVMLMGLARPLKEGERFAITLVLANGERIPVTVAIRKIGAMGPAGQGGHGAGAMHGR